jgi:glutamate-1-semialdehyde 2,1-aminomutase
VTHAAHGVLLIFSETVTSFRFAFGGAKERYGVVPDISTLGKIIGGGFLLPPLGPARKLWRISTKRLSWLRTG